MATLYASDRRVSGSIPGWFRFGFVEPHYKNHSKGAKIPQFHSKYYKFRMYQGLNYRGAQPGSKVGSYLDRQLKHSTRQSGSIDHDPARSRLVY